MGHRIRQLIPGDLPALNRFLELHPRSSMFLMSNLARTGLSPDQGRPFQATYVGVFLEEELVGVVALCWNGMVLVQAPTAVGELAVAVTQLIERPLSGLAGPHLQVHDAMDALNLISRRKTMDRAEILYALRLDELLTPEVDTNLEIRRALPEDTVKIGHWNMKFQIESLGVRPESDLEEKCLKLAQRGIERGDIWVGVVSEALVSMSGFNATLKDRVQLGGVYTPPELRSRGYSRRVIAESLRAIHLDGVQEAILFTDPDNGAAQACYESLGFKRVGQYGLVQLDPSFP